MSRSSVIPYFLKKKIIRIHKGKNWKALRINRWNVGYKFGEFSWTRKYVKYRSKTMKKTLKKQLKGKKKLIELVEDPKNLKFRQVRSGFLKKNLGMFDTIDNNFYLSHKKVIK